jgi:hypothetical protein
VIKRIAPILLLLAFLPLPVYAQIVGASLTGHVVDPSGAAISGAKVKLTETAKGTVYTAGSSDAGVYQFPFVLIGTYSLSAEKEGFKKHDQAGIDLLAGQKAVIDVTLQLGAVTQTVNVTANATVLNLESGDRNAVISNVRLDPEVFRGQNTIITTWFTPGVTITAGAQKLRPWDNGGTQGEVINGGQAGGGGNLQQGQGSGNQVMVDGVSINRGGNGTGFNPMASSVDQVVVQGTMYDSQFGWSTGGHINTLTKSGSNTWHGHGYDYLQNTLLNAQDWGSMQSGPGGTNVGRQPWHINMFGGEIGGPLRKDKIFVFYAYQMIWQIQRDPYTATVPTAAERQGDFRGVCVNASGNCTQVQLFDPTTTATTSSLTDPTSCYYTTTGITAGNNPCRSQSGPSFSAPNIINPAAINPIAKNILNFIPLPVLTGGVVPCAGVVSGQTGNVAGLCGNFSQNKLNDAQSRKFVDYFPEHSGRIDWNFNDRTHAFFRFSKNHLAETRSYIYDTVSYHNPAETSGNNPLFRGNQAYVLQVTHTFNPTTVMELRTGMDRYPSGGGNITVAATDPTTLGFSSTWRAQAGHMFPRIDVTGMGNGSGGQLAGGNLPSYTASDVWNHEVVVAHTHGQHNIRFGYQRFDLADLSENPGFPNGYFQFTGYFTSRNPTGSIGNTGLGMADFLLGNQAGGYIQTLAYPSYWMHEHSLFLQDDWHLSRRFTLNAGIRWDYAGPVHDKKYNRLISGFCATCPNPIGFIPGVGNLLGGVTYANVGGLPSGITNKKYENFGPRIGFAYDMGHNLVLRGGWGIIYAQQILEPGGAPGFSVTTSMVPVPGPAGVYGGSVASPSLSFANALPSGLVAPWGSKYGLATNIGQGISFPDPNMDIPRTQQYSLEVQKSFGKDWMVSLAYVGSRAARLNINQNINYLPLAALPYNPDFTLNTSAPGGGGSATVSYEGTQVANPFYGMIPAQYAPVIPGTFLNNATTSRSQLMLPYPQFGGITELWRPFGKSHYNSLQIEVNKRLGYGLEFSSSFTWSRTLQSLGFLNAQDAYPRQTMAPYDLPRQAKINFAYFAPFGPGKKFLAQSNPVVSRLVSGWSLSATPMLMDGFPMPTPANVMPTGAAQTTPSPTLSHWFNTCYLDNSSTPALHNCTIDSTPAWKQTVSGQLYEWDPYMHGVRYVGHHRLDASIKKETQIKERFGLTFRADFINAFNSSEFNQNANVTFNQGTFGMVGEPYSAPSTDPRVIELSLQIKF